MSTKDIMIAKDYSAVPGGRFAKYGPYSGEDFRDNVLAPALRENDLVIVRLDDTKTLMSSFLEEAFGGLIRVCGFQYDDLKAHLRVQADAPKYSIFLKMIQQNLVDAAAQAAAQKSSKVA